MEETQLYKTEDGFPIIKISNDDIRKIIVLKAKERYKIKIGKNGSVESNETGIAAEFAIEFFCKSQNLEKFHFGFNYKENFKGMSDKNDCFIYSKKENKKMLVEIKGTSKNPKNSAGVRSFLQRREYLPNQINGPIIFCHVDKKENTVLIVGYIDAKEYNQNIDNWINGIGMVEISMSNSRKIEYLIPEFKDWEKSCESLESLNNKFIEEIEYDLNQNDAISNFY